MALLKYFSAIPKEIEVKYEDNVNKKQDNGPSISPTFQETVKKKRGEYMKYKEEDKLKIGKYNLNTC